MYSQDYNSPSCESGKGNVSADLMFYVFDGTEAVDTVVRLRKMSENNSYMRITAIPDSGMAAGTSVDVGYASREDGGADDPDFFAAGVALDGGNVDVITDLKPVPEKHDVTIQIKANGAGNAGKKVKLLVEFINTAG